MIELHDPVAWMHDGPGRVDVIHSEVKNLWLKMGQPPGFFREKTPCKVEHYTTPLYTAQALHDALEQAAKVCDGLADAYKGLSEHTLLTVSGKQVHQGMYGGAVNCSSAIRRLLSKGETS